MKKHDIGQLRAFLDGELSAGERQAVAEHLDRCASCASELALMKQRATGLAQTLGALDGSAPAPVPQASLARFQRSVAAQERAGRPALRENVTRSLEMIKRNAISPRWRPAFVALSAVLVVALLFSVAPIRSAAADFLSLFRIQKFAVIPLDQQQLGRLEDLAKQAEGQFGEPQVVREKGPEVPVADAAAASALAGYTVRTPSRVPTALGFQKMTVQAGPAMHYEIDRAALEAFLQAAGVSTTGLPQTDKLTFDVDVANFVAQQFGGGTNRLEFVQVPSPKVDLPEGIDPAALAETGFLFLGMPAEDAHRLATSIDWTSTLVVPLPTDSAQAREVTVDGVSGLLLEGTNSNRHENALVWEKDGILYSLSGRVDTLILIDAADSLQ